MRWLALALLLAGCVNDESPTEPEADLVCTFEQVADSLALECETTDANG